MHAPRNLLLSIFWCTCWTSTWTDDGHTVDQLGVSGNLVDRGNSSNKCLTYSPAYPSLGGAGCSAKCSPGRSSYAAVFYYSNETAHDWPRDLVRNMHFAASILKKHGAPNSLDTERSCYLHVTFDYYCCYTLEEGAKIGEFLESYTWKPHEVWFDRLACAIHGEGDMVSLVLMVEQERTQEQLLRWALENERLLTMKTRILKHFSRTQLQEFHMTLGTVNQSTFPVQLAVNEINRIIPPGTWHSTPVVLHKPVCKKCETAAAKLS